MVMSTIGKRVTYTGIETYRGTVEDEVQLLELYKDIDFLDLIQLIRWDKGDYGIRFCYYWKDHKAGDDSWTFAIRPLSTSPEKLAELLRRARGKPWFSKLLKQEPP